MEARAARDGEADPPPSFPPPSPVLEYKLVEVDGAAAAVAWQDGPNRVVELPPAAASVAVDDAWAAGAPAVTVRGAETAPAKAAPVVAPRTVAPAAAAPAAATPAPAAPAPAASAPGADMTVSQLKSALKAAGLPTGGKKADLVARLAAARRA